MLPDCRTNRKSMEPNSTKGNVAVVFVHRLNIVVVFVADIVVLLFFLSKCVKNFGNILKMFFLFNFCIICTYIIINIRLKKNLEKILDSYKKTNCFR